LEISVSAYADDLVLISPSWRTMQNLLHILGDQASILDKSCNVQKTVSVVFQPKQRDKFIANPYTT